MHKCLENGQAYLDHFYAVYVNKHKCVQKAAKEDFFKKVLKSLKDLDKPGVASKPCVNMFLNVSINMFVNMYITCVCKH